MGKYVLIMIELPISSGNQGQNMLRQLKLLVDTVDQSLVEKDNFSISREYWYSISDFRQSVAFESVDGRDSTKWEDALLSMAEGIYGVTGFLSYVNNHRTKPLFIRFMGQIKQNKAQKEMGMREARFLNVNIPKEIWEVIDQSQIIKVLQNICLISGARYACVHDGLGPHTPNDYEYNECLEEAADSSEKNMLPGVFWAQFITAAIVENTGDLERIKMEAPCVEKEMIEGSDSKGLWLQVSPSIWNVPARKRMAMRDYFSKSLLDLS